MSILERVDYVESLMRTEDNNRHIRQIYEKCSLEDKQRLLDSIEVTKQDLSVVKGMLSNYNLTKILESLEDTYSERYFKRVITYQPEESVIYSVKKVELSDAEIENIEPVIQQAIEDAYKIQKIHEDIHNRNADRLNPHGYTYTGGRI